MPEEKARVRAQRSGLPRREAWPEYGPDTTGCPAVEQAIDGLYEGQDEESFWTLMSALNYAMQVQTEVLVPLEAAPDDKVSPAKWAEHPVPAGKGQDMKPWLLCAENDRKFRVVFTSSEAANSDRVVSRRPMARRSLRTVMESVRGDKTVNGLVINPWSRSATLDHALLNGLLTARRNDEAVPGDAEYDQGCDAWCKDDFAAAYESFQLSALLGNPAGMRMLGICCREGKGTPRDLNRAEAYLEDAAQQGDLPARIELGDLYAAGEEGSADPGRALMAYRQAYAAAKREPDIEYWPELCLRLAQYEVQFTSRREALNLLAEARQGLTLRQDAGDAAAAPLLAETERLCRKLTAPAWPRTAYAEGNSECGIRNSEF